MGQTNVERQAAYRQRHLKDLDAQAERLNTLVSTSTKRRLERLAAHYGVTQRALLEKLVADAERAVVDALPADAQSAYYAPKR